MVVCVEKNNIYKYAESKNIKTCDYSEDRKLLEKIICDLGVLAWWPKLIKEPLLSMPKNGYINTHPSLLPYNRGKHYNFWALVEKVPFGVTLHFIDSGIDTGDIVFQKSIPYDWCDTGETLYKKAQAEMINLFIEKYHLIRIKNYKKKYQDLNSGSFHHSSELNKICEIGLNEKYQAPHFLNLLPARTFEGYLGCFSLKTVINTKFQLLKKLN